MKDEIFLRSRESKENRGWTSKGDQRETRNREVEENQVSNLDVKDGIANQLQKVQDI